MQKPLIGLTGYARSGKDEAARALVDRGWRRVAFADAVRECLLAIDPIVETHADVFVRLSSIVATEGWEAAKAWPEVRGLLQRVGTEAGRLVIDEDVWVSLVYRKIYAAQADAEVIGVVVTDVRFANEARMIRDLGGEIYRVERPGVGPVNAHASDTAIGQIEVDGVLTNDGDAAQWRERVAARFCSRSEAA
jgi:hypothetical protein